MSRSTAVLTLTGSLVALGTIAWFCPKEPATTKQKSSPVAVIGDPDKVARAYEAWRTEFEATSAPRIDIGLAWSRGLSTEYSPITGSAAFHLDTGAVEVELVNAPVDECYDVWLTQSTPESQSVAIETSDRFVWLGTITGAGYDAAKLDTKLADVSEGVLELDLVVVTRSGKTPLQEGLLFGMPGLFERVWTSERARDAYPTIGSSGLSLALLVQSWTPPPPGSTPSFAALVAQGEQLFFEETFGGNHRTCGTCHPAENNLTLDPDFIAQMHETDPFDPLFVAEFDPNLMAEFNDGRKFENPELMHEQALILENLDGFGDLKNRFTMRGISHVFAQSVSILRPPPAQPLPRQRTGWSGDGAPGSGRLREFAIGAVTQHFTRSLERMQGVDFILPDNAQLDALEAFQLSLGRTVDPNIVNLSFADQDAGLGRDQFAFRCNFCHDNAGANSLGTFVGAALLPNTGPTPLANGNFNTGVEARLQSLINGGEAQRPTDGGFGVIPIDPVATTTLPPPGELVPNADGSFGDKTFNSQSIVEAADTLPNFHNNLTMIGSSFGNTIEGAIEFYRSPAFLNSPAGLAGISNSQNFTDTDVKQIGRFLRSLNGMENARSAKAFAQHALVLGNSGAAENLIQRALQVAHADATDGRDVQSEVGLNTNSVLFFKNARDRIEKAQDTNFTWSQRAQFLASAIQSLTSARTEIATP